MSCRANRCPPLKTVPPDHYRQGVFVITSPPWPSYVPLYEPPKPTPFGTLKELQMTEYIGKSFSNVPAQSYTARIKTEQLYVHINRAPFYRNVISLTKCTIPDAGQSTPENNHEDSVLPHHVWSAALNCVPSIIEIRQHYAGGATTSNGGHFSVRGT